MIARLRYLGRALMVEPGALGPALEDHCTVRRREDVTEWVTDAVTGLSRPVRTRAVKKIPLFWYEKLNEAEVFCTYSGYGPWIEQTLRKRGFAIKLENFVSDGLGAPDLTPVKGTIWRTGQKTVFAKLLGMSRGIIQCPTGWGKTFLAKLLAKVYPTANILITVNSNDIADEIFDGLKYDLGRELGRIGGRRSIKDKRVVVCTSQSLHKAPKDVNIVLADECHTLMTEQYVKKFQKFRRAKIFGFSASPTGRSDGAEGFGEAIFGPIIVEVGYQDSVKGGNVVQLAARLYPSTRGPDVSKIQNAALANRLGIWTNAARNELIANVVRETEQEVGPDEQILIMVSVVEHAYVLGQLLPDYVVVSGEPTPERVQQMLKKGVMTPDQEVCTKQMREDYKRQFSDYTLKRAIATKIWSKGVNFPDLLVLVRADGTASPIDSCQVPGRLSRLGKEVDKKTTGGILIDFVDTFSSNLQYRSQQRIAVYRSNGFSIERRK